MLRHSRSRLLWPVLAALFLSSCGEEEKSFPVRTYNLGDRIELGHIVYVVFETQWLTHIGDPATGRVPQNRFFLIRFSATNGGSNDSTVGNPTITDDKGQTYEELSNG